LRAGERYHFRMAGNISISTDTILRFNNDRVAFGNNRGVWIFPLPSGFDRQIKAATHHSFIDKMSAQFLHLPLRNY
jgi:hypothetical protein